MQRPRFNNQNQPKNKRLVGAEPLSRSSPFPADPGRLPTRGSVSKGWHFLPLVLIPSSASPALSLVRLWRGADTRVGSRPHAQASAPGSQETPTRMLPSSKDFPTNTRMCVVTHTVPNGNWGRPNPQYLRG
jgi:hypothetical protein